MTGEKIKDEFERWMSDPEMTKEESAFPNQFEDSKGDDTEFLAHGFYAGFRAAERLAKIEILEAIREIFLSNSSKITTMVKLERMIKEIKTARD